VLTFISPILEGPKWKLKFLQLNPNKEQLLLHSCYSKEPHVEDTDLKSSVASSDEERLAADITTTGLQTKRLSGPQRKRLTKERNMSEQTWMQKKPPGKTPSQDKGAIGSSGGVKRPHSDWSTPPLEKQQPKNPGTLKCRLGHIRKLLLASI
jgi:hypothetical protein